MTDGCECCAKFIVGHLAERVRVDVQFFGQDRCDHLQVLVGLFLTDLSDHTDAVFLEVLVQGSDEGLAKRIPATLGTSLWVGVVAGSEQPRLGRFFVV